MHASTNYRARVVTELDHVRLSRLAMRAQAPQLAELLDEAELVGSTEVPDSVVTMNSRFVVRDLDAQEQHVLRLCYPPDADVATGCISVLSPAGLACLGLQVGTASRWVGPAGEARVVVLDAMIYQPEASGDYLV